MTPPAVKPPTVLLQHTGVVGRIVLNRPEKRNALSTRMLAELGALVEEVADDAAIRVVTVHGAGPVFCAGADTVEFGGCTPEDIRGRWTRLGQQVFGALAELPQPTVAVLTGGAYGGGLELAMHCDFRIAATRAVVALPEATLGTAPGWNGLARIAELAGLGAARRLALTGRALAAPEALRLGLLDEVSDDVSATLDALVADLLAAHPVAVSILKRALITAPAGGAVDSLAGAYLAQLTPSGRT